MGNIFWQTLKFQKKSLIFWAIGLIGLIILYIALYPSIKESAAELNAYIDKLPEAMRDAFIDSDTDYASPLGYISSEIYSQMLPILFLIFAIAFGSAAVAGEEDKGTIDLLLSAPVRRSQVIIEKTLALIICLAVLSVVVIITLFVTTPLVDIEITLQQLAAATFNLLLFGLNIGIVALFLGSVTGSKGLAIGLTTAFAILAFLVNTFYKLTDVLENVKEFSPFYHYSHQNALIHGVDWPSVGLLVFISIGLVLLSMAAFARRDLKV